MNRQAIIRLTANILLRYYDNDTNLFLEHVDDNVLWYGPAEGQFLRGKDALVSAWAAEEGHPLTFSMGNIRAEMSSPGPSLCIVVVQFSVVTHYPTGNDIAINQRVAFTWYERVVPDGQGGRVRVPRILLCDITNPHPKSADDDIYPVHFERVYSGFTTSPGTGERIHFRGVQGREYYLRSDLIVWGESCSRGKRCKLHLTDGKVVEVTMPVRSVVAEHPTLFLRSHSSNLINPKQVTSLRRFVVTMSDGTELPIPEKSYTRFRRALNELA